MARSSANTAGMPGAGSALAPDLRKRIEIMAEHIARNGPDFEATVRAKNVSNPQFAFLYAGEGADYYSQLLAAYRGTPVAPSGGDSGAAVQTSAASMMARSPGSSGQTTAAGAMPSLSEMLKGSGQNAGNGHGGIAVSEHRAPTARAGGSIGSASFDEEPQVELADVLQRWREPPVYPMTPEAERQLADIIGSLEQMASRDAVRNGRLWLEANVGIAQEIAGNVMKRIVLLPSCAHRLHVLYLVHDALQTEATRKDSTRPVFWAFKPYLVWLLRPAYQLAQSTNAGGDEGPRVLRLLQLWVERNILEKGEADELRAIVCAPELPGHQLAAAQAAANAVARGLPRPPLPRPVSAMNAGTAARPLAPTPVGAMMPAGAVRPTMAPSRAMYPSSMPGLAAAQGGPGAYRPQVQPLQAGKQSPETVPVGVMATMLRNFIRHNRTAHAEFVPYKPMDPNLTPQVLPHMGAATQQLMERVEDFYEDLQDDREERPGGASSSSSRSSSRSGSRSRSRSRARRVDTDPRAFAAAVAAAAADAAVATAMGGGGTAPTLGTAIVAD